MNIVVMGGGTGTYTALMGLKKYPCNLISIVSMMDSGGSTGILRDEFGVLPPGDVRRCIVALSESTPLMKKLFQYRFAAGNGLKGHSFGNLFITALKGIMGSDAEAIKQACTLLNIKGKVLPVTLNNVHLCAELENGQLIKGETNIDIPKHDPALRIRKIFLEPQAKAFEEAVHEILDADKIIIGPGDLYTSVLPNLLVEGIREAISQSKAQKVYVCNVMTKYGETNNFQVHDFAGEVEKYLGKGVLDLVIFNDKKAGKHLLERYAQEHAAQVGFSLEKMGKWKFIKTDLMTEPNLIRHDSDKLAKVIFES
ncbi:MAG: YvcK family protein [Candidatus Aenigmarchaeota archaeon]|nr:YvcK family protein [Candidatus Aenigmarchaeota archaeon]